VYTCLPIHIDSFAKTIISDLLHVWWSRTSSPVDITHQVFTVMGSYIMLGDFNLGHYSITQNLYASQL